VAQRLVSNTGASHLVPADDRGPSKCGPTPRACPFPCSSMSQDLLEVDEGASMMMSHVEIVQNGATRRNTSNTVTLTLTPHLTEIPR